MKRQTIKELKQEIEQFRTDKLKSLNNYMRLQAINTELKAEVDTLRIQLNAYSHSNEFLEGQIKAYRDMLRLNNGN